MGELKIAIYANPNQTEKTKIGKCEKKVHFISDGMKYEPFNKFKDVIIDISQDSEIRIHIL